MNGPYLLLLNSSSLSCTDFGISPIFVWSDTVLCVRSHFSVVRHILCAGGFPFLISVRVTFRWVGSHLCIIGSHFACSVALPQTTIEYDICWHESQAMVRESDKLVEEGCSVVSWLEITTIASVSVVS